MRVAARLSLATFFLFLLILLPASSSPLADREPIHEALHWVQSAPRQFVQYNYMMTARLRLLFFWASKDDVGGGYIRRGVSTEDPRLEFIQVLFGSDPEKAPRAINRWGAGTEVSWHKEAIGSAHSDEVTASAFFGFMKSSRGKSASEMQSELEREKKQGLHDFTGILSRVEPVRAVSLVVPLESDTDFNLRDYARAEPLMLERLSESPRPVKSLEDSGRCPRSAGFLATAAELVDDAVQGLGAPISRCYVYDAQENTLELQKISPVKSLAVRLSGPKNVVLLETIHKNVLQLDFVSTHKLTGKKVYFTIYAGSEGALRGVPVQICYQPNWWFQVILNLLPQKPIEQGSAIASAKN
jgi:hypothetical protein